MPLTIARAAILGILLSAVATPVFAHVTSPEDASDTWSEAWTLLTLGLVTILYGRGVRRSPHLARGRAFAFASGIIVLLLALASPLDRLSGELFSMHMVQHELLMVLAAPLLVLSRPFGPLLQGVPERPRRAVVSTLAVHGVRRTWEFLRLPLVAWLIHFAALWVWHIPAGFELALRSEPVHFLQHLTFLLSALLFWHALLGSREGHGAAILYVFTTALHASILGALLTFAPTVWYAPYADTARWGLTALEDQQLGGLVMWVIGVLPYLATALCLLAGMLRERDWRQFPDRSVET